MFTSKAINTFNKNILLLIVMFAFTLFSAQLYATDTADDVATQNPELQLHSALVLKALQVDFYNVRCRGISVAKNFNKVNRLYITKYSLTANNFIKNFINPDVRAEKQIQEIDFKKNLNKLGGCSKAKEQGWIKQIHDEYKNLYQQAEQSTWFPEV